MTIGWTTIAQGEAIAVWSLDGTCKIVHGPKRLFLWRQRAAHLSLFAAHQGQYLSIHKLDGAIQNVKGPASLFLDPLLYQSIQVKDAISLTSHEVLVVYRPSPMPEEAKQGYTAQVSRTIIRGPVMHVPEADEWVHEFVWHGSDPNNKTRKIPNGSRFTKLRVIPDQFYYNIGDVRTKDDALITVKCMIFFELANIEQMLDTTHDPIADFINSVTADVVAFTASKTYEEFVDKTDELNRMQTYAQLTQRAERIGYRISKVVYRGYHASDKLQRMHDDSIEARTSLRLQAETEGQAQQLQDLKLKKDIERAIARRQMEAEEAQHKLSQERAKNAAELEFTQKTNNEQIRYFSSLQSAGVDLTQYLVSQFQHPDKIIRVENKSLDGSGGFSSHQTQAPILHLNA